MSIASWKDEYCTGYPQVDQEHQELFAIVNALHNAMMREKARPVLKEVLQTLADHTVEHFQTEELLMQESGYPGYGRHKQVHDGLTAKVVKLLQIFDHPETEITIALTEFLAEWLVHHIKGEDQRMIRFFREKVQRENPTLLAPPVPIASRF